MKRTKSFALIASILLCLVVFVSASFAANPLLNPRGLAVDAKGNLWVANKQGGSAGIGNILAFNPDYERLTNKTITNAILDPTGVAFDAEGNFGSPTLTPTKPEMDTSPNSPTVFSTQSLRSQMVSFNPAH